MSAVAATSFMSASARLMRFGRPRRHPLKIWRSCRTWLGCSEWRHGYYCYLHAEWGCFSFECSFEAQRTFVFQLGLYHPLSIVTFSSMLCPDFAPLASEVWCLWNFRRPILIPSLGSAPSALAWLAESFSSALPPDHLKRFAAFARYEWRGRCSMSCY